jgi:Fe-S cluster assembly ATPase SufC
MKRENTGTRLRFQTPATIAGVTASPALANTATVCAAGDITCAVRDWDADGSNIKNLKVTCFACDSIAFDQAAKCTTTTNGEATT